MLGKILGNTVTLPLKIASIPIKTVERVCDEESETVSEGILDVAKKIENVCEDCLDR